MWNDSICLCAFIFECYISGKRLSKVALAVLWGRDSISRHILKVKTLLYTSALIMPCINACHLQGPKLCIAVFNLLTFFQGWQSFWCFISYTLPHPLPPIKIDMLFFIHMFFYRPYHPHLHFVVLGELMILFSKGQLLTC